MKDIIKALNEYCYEHGISQVELAKKLGVSFQTVNRWVNGKVKPSNLQIRNITNFLKNLSTKGPVKPDISKESSDSPILFRFEEPLQKRIYDSLVELIGPGPATFFRDACKLMHRAKTAVELETTTHLVGHLIRETDSSVRGVLRPLAEKHIPPNTQNENQKRKQEINAIINALNLDGKEPYIKSWINIRIDKYAHRSALSLPRPISPKFLDFWNNIQFTYDVLLQKLKDHYVFYVRQIDDILKTSQPGKKEITRLRNQIPNNFVIQRYFFEQLYDKTPLWLDLLYKNGYFKNLPEPEYDTEKQLTYYTLWPASRYLAHIASKKIVKPDIVLQVITDIPKTKNTRIHVDIADCALHLSPELSLKAIKGSVEEWLSLPFNYSLPEKLASLINHLAQGHEIDGALWLTKVLFTVKPESRHSNRGKGKFRLPPEPKAHFDSWHYSDELNKLIPNLVNYCGTKALICLCDLLEAAIVISSSNRRSKDAEDYSYVWCSTISDSDKHEREIKKILLLATSKAARQLVQSDNAKIIEVITLLEKRRWHSFHRISLYILREFPELSFKLIEERLTKRELFDAAWARCEYWSLAGSIFNKLSPDKQQLLLVWLKDGPKVKDKEPDYEQYKKIWQRDRLGWISCHLQGEWKKMYEEFVKAFGPPSTPEVFSIHTGWHGPTSPKSKEDLKIMSAQEIISFLKNWRAPESGWSDSAEGLGRILSTVVAEEPQKFIPSLSNSQELDPTYVRSLLDGFQQALKEKRSFPWKPVIDLCNWVVSQPRQIPGRQVVKHHLSYDPDWGWTRKQIARLLEEGLTDGSCSIDIALRKEIWPILEILVEDPEPDNSDISREPATQSINTVRGEAMHAIIRYALWIRRSFEEKKDIAKLDRGFNEMPEVKQVLERHLDLNIEKSLAIRSVYGQWLPWLVLLDTSWVSSNLHRMLPRERGQKEFRDTAWETYICFCSPYDNIFDVIKQEYVLAIERINGNEKHAKSEEALTGHLMSFAYRGKINIDDPNDLLSLFWAKAPLSLKQYSMEFLGRTLYNSKENIPPRIKERFMKLWDKRISTIKLEKKMTDTALELNGFGWWFISEKFDETWDLNQLTSALELGAQIDPNHLVIERLSKLVTTHPLLVAKALILIIDSSKDEWLISGAKNEISNIISVVYSNSDQAVKKVGSDLINRLVAKGYIDFSKFLRGGGHET